MSKVTIKVRSAPIKVKVSGAQGPAGIDDPRSAFGTNKATIVDADRFAILDSGNSNLPKHGLWSLVKSTLKTYFDGIYHTVGGALGTPTSGNLTNCTFPTLNQSTTGNAGTVTTINGRIAAGTNVTLSGSGTAGSPYTLSSSASGADIVYSETAPLDTTAIWVDPKTAKTAIYIGGGWVILKGSSGGSTPYLPYEPETFAYLGNAGIDFVYAEQLDLFIKGLKLEGAWDDCSMWILDTRYQSAGTTVVGTGGIPINGLKENGLGVITESAEEYYFSRGTARVWTPEVLMPTSPLMSLMMVAKLPQQGQNFGSLFGGRNTFIGVDGATGYDKLGIGSGTTNQLVTQWSGLPIGTGTPNTRGSYFLSVSGERSGVSSYNGGELVVSTPRTHDYTTLTKDTQSTIFGPGDYAAQSAAPAAASFVAFWRTDQSTKASDIYDLYNSTVGSHLDLP